MSLLPLVCVQEDIKTILVRSFTSALLPLSFPMIFFPFLRQKQLCFNHVYIQLCLLNIKLKSSKISHLLSRASWPWQRAECCRSKMMWLLLLLTPACLQSSSGGQKLLQEAKIVYGSWQDFVVQYFCVCLPAELEKVVSHSTGQEQTGLKSICLLFPCTQQWCP